MAHWLWQLGSCADSNRGVSVTLTNGRWDCSCMRNKDIESGKKHSPQHVCEKYMKDWRYFETFTTLYICEYFKYVFTEFRGVCVWSQHSIYWRPTCSILPFRRGGEQNQVICCLGGKGCEWNLVKWKISLASCRLFIFYFFNKFIYFIYLFLAALGLRCCARAFSSCGERGLLFVAVCGLLIVVASLIAEHRL